MSDAYFDRMERNWERRELNPPDEWCPHEWTTAPDGSVTYCRYCGEDKWSEAMPAS